MPVYFFAHDDLGVNSEVSSYGLPVVSSLDELGKEDFLLVYKKGLFQLSPVDKSFAGALDCNLDHQGIFRLLASTGIKTPIAKAVGCKQGLRPTVLDLTAGFAQDALMLAGAGCKVDLIEKNPAVYLMLSSALIKGSSAQNSALVNAIKNLTLLPRQSSLDFLSETQNQYHTVYIDPMFPTRKKQAKVKKTMQFFHQVVGEDDNDPTQLFSLATQIASKRVVIKRSSKAPHYIDKVPDLIFDTKTTRFDVYFI